MCFFLEHFLGHFLGHFLIALLTGLLLPTTTAILNRPRYPGYDYGNSTKAIIEHQPSSPKPYIITIGAKGGTGVNGSLLLRLEIRQSQKKPVLWTLYILGLDFLQRNKNQSSDLESWYQLAGIHGCPFQPFDNAQALKGNENSGFCQHVSILFLPWHRPYLALYEVRHDIVFLWATIDSSTAILHKAIQIIARLYPAEVRDIYVASAANFRIPFWD